MTGKRGDSPARRGANMSLNRRILRNTILNILALVVICCIIMAMSLQSLANSILLDSLQPMARQSAKTVEANVHMLADRMMTIAGDSRLVPAAVPNPDETQPPCRTPPPPEPDGRPCWKRPRRSMSCTPSPCMTWRGVWCRGSTALPPAWTAASFPF